MYRNGVVNRPAREALFIPSHLKSHEMEMEMKRTLVTILVAMAPLAVLADSGGKRGFEGIDTDADGRISRAEMQANVGERANQGFDRLDADKDGYLTREEFAAARAQGRGAIKERFEAADTDSSGTISRAEADAGLPQLAERFDEIDADKDGYLDAGEMRAALKKRRR